MQSENIFIAHPTTVDQLNVLKAVVKALKIKFEVRKDEKAYDSEFVEKIKESKKQFENGQFKVINTEDLWK
jgi:hypothetical protein